MKKEPNQQIHLTVLPQRQNRKVNRAVGHKGETKMNEKGTSPGIFEKLIAPIIIGVVVLLGQWLIQPMIGEATSQKVELLNAK